MILLTQTVVSQLEEPLENQGGSKSHSILNLLGWLASHIPKTC